MRTVYLVNSAQPRFADGERICLSNTELPLSDEGRLQAELLYEYFKDKALGGVFNSTLPRAKQTAQIISPDAKTMAGMHELGMGDWEGLTFDRIKQEYPELWRLREEDPEKNLPANGEPLAVCARRAYISLFGLLDRTEGDVVVVTHEGLIRALLCRIESAQYKDCFRWELPCGSVSTIAENSGELAVLEKGATPSAG